MFIPMDPRSSHRFSVFSKLLSEMVEKEKVQLCNTRVCLSDKANSYAINVDLIGSPSSSVTTD